MLPLPAPFFPKQSLFWMNFFSYFVEDLVINSFKTEAVIIYHMITASVLKELTQFLRSTICDDIYVTYYFLYLTFLSMNLWSKKLKNEVCIKMKFSKENFFSKCDQIHRKLWIWSHLLKKSLMENFNFGAVW